MPGDNAGYKETLSEKQEDHIKSQKLVKVNLENCHTTGNIMYINNGHLASVTRESSKAFQSPH
jgi:hypothetical protein